MEYQKQIADTNSLVVLLYLTMYSFRTKCYVFVIGKA